MDARTLRLLELPAILERLAAETASEPGAALAEALLPSPDPVEVARRQALTAEAIALLDEAAEPRLDGIRDVREAVELAARGGVLQPARLRDLRVAVATALAARRALEQVEAPGLRELAEAFDPGLAPVAEEIGAAVEDDGSDLRDSASPRLRSLRRELRNGRHEAAERLRRLARGSELRDHLQEDFVSERGGRPVLAVKASSRSSVPGIVHDASSSGQTLFVEPFAVV